MQIIWESLWHQPAVDTIYKHFVDTGRKPEDYDVIATGDLGAVGKKLTEELLKEYGYDISKVYIDCGEKIFDNEKQGTFWAEVDVDAQPL